MSLLFSSEEDISLQLVVVRPRVIPTSHFSMHSFFRCLILSHHKSEKGEEVLVVGIGGGEL